MTEHVNHSRRLLMRSNTAATFVAKAGDLEGRLAAGTDAGRGFSALDRSQQSIELQSRSGCQFPRTCWRRPRVGTYTVGKFNYCK